ncbi:DUF3253 domain-containing protein [uncultured Roseobacter sp.]|uniref:DUF3253 domain-containing protein n=1 Tax=uncultured Roseobacter sp. TaxID=114847 RepID=UPI00262968CA|nr:DUF3253 domain-containing protein [uncultured Roseobacter sp.]
MTQRLVDRDRIAGEIRAQARARGLGASLCPSEVARALAPSGWRDLMEAVRGVADDLADQGEITVTQRGKRVRAGTARGPIRLGLRARE